LNAPVGSLLGPLSRLRLCSNAVLNSYETGFRLHAERHTLMGHLPPKPAVPVWQEYGCLFLWGGWDALDLVDTIDFPKTTITSFNVGKCSVISRKHDSVCSLNLVWVGVNCRNIMLV
jgi:hypothetical protein